MNRYNDGRSCSKCGHNDGYARWTMYDSTDPEFKALYNRTELVTGQEIMLRHCSFCSIEWAEEPLNLDAKVTLDFIVQQLRTKVDPAIILKEEDEGHYRVFTPYIFDDGDHLSIILKWAGTSWVFSDGGHDALMRGTISDLQQRKINSLLAVLQVKDKNGELILIVHENRFDYALKTFVSTLISLECITYMSNHPTLLSNP